MRSRVARRKPTNSGVEAKGENGLCGLRQGLVSMRCGERSTAATRHAVELLVAVKFLIGTTGDSRGPRNNGNVDDSNGETKM